MTELFRSAFNYLSQTTPSNVNVIGKLDHQLVGTNIEISGLKLKIRSLIAEGGYALVFSAQDTQGNWFALKRQLAADGEAAKAILKEIRFLRQLSGLQSILQFVQAAQLSPQESGHGRAEFLLLTELCPGSVIELIQKGPLSVKQVTKIFYAACNAIKQMHSRIPSITHRDMKIENLLFDASGYVKLCDFGSATTEIVTPDETWSALQRAQLEEELARYTTPMYRAPELLDMYSNFPVGPAQDIWALGCVLYYLCYRKHPFEDSAKLRIINAKYSLPDAETEYTVLNQLIQTTLQVDPRERPNAEDLCERVEALAAALCIDLSKPVENLDLPQLSAFCSSGQLKTESSANERGKSSKSNTSKRSPSTPRKNDYEQAAQQASAVFGAIKGQSMSWLKNIKDKTTAVAQTVQSTYGNRGPDVTFVTSRLVIAPFADCIPEALIAQAEEAMRAYILDQTRGQFAIYNLSNRHLRCDYNHLIETPLPSVGSGLTPTVNFLLNLCRSMVLFLKQKETNFILITGPEVQCLLVAAALLLYARLVPRPLAALELICTKRQPPDLPPSYHRQLDVIKTIVSMDSSDLCAIVHNRRVVLRSLLISPVPLFNRARSGCRPFADIYAGGTKVWSTGKNYEELKSFEAPESVLVDLPLGDIPVGDDVQVVVFHARLMKMQNRIQQCLMFSLNFHANFIDPNTHMLEFNLGDLDRQFDDSRFGMSLKVGLQLKIDEYDRGFSAREPPAILSYEPKAISKMLLVSEPDEFDAIVRHLGLRSSNSSNRRNLPKIPLSSQKHFIEQHKVTSENEEKLNSETNSSHPQNSFFSTLEWMDATDNLRNAAQNITEPVQNNSEQHNVRQPSEHSTILFSSLSERAQEEDKNDRDSADLYERMNCIRVTEAEISDDSQYNFNCEEQSKVIEKNVPEILTVGKDADLLGLEIDLHTSCSTNHSQLVNDLENSNLSSTNVSAHYMQDIFSCTSDNASSDYNAQFGNTDFYEDKMQRNVFTPVFSTVDDTASTSEMKSDPFAEFLACTKNNTISPSKNNSATTGGVVLNNQRQPNYSRTHFDTLSSSCKPKNFENVFDDLLTSQGFQTSAKTMKSLDEMKRQEEIKELDPIKVKVKEWTNGKEGNIRALLGSMNDILWPNAGNWIQPSIGDLLTSQQIKKYYHKACLVIHPDKQVGTENEALARAVFTELNDAWTTYENSGDTLFKAEREILYFQSYCEEIIIAESALLSKCCDVGSRNINDPLDQCASSSVLSESSALSTLSYESSSSLKTFYDCPICFQLFREPYSTLCGHSFCRECISAHLERSLRCPVCSRDLDPRSGPIVFPNFTAASIVDAIRRNMKTARNLAATSSRNEELELTSEKLIDLALNADARFLDHFMDLLKKRREQISNNVTRRKNMLLNEFIDEMIAQREEKLKRLQNELSILRNDKASIQALMKDEPSGNVGTHSQRMVPDASGSQIAHPVSALKKVKFDDDDDGGDEMEKYRSRLQQHMAGLEQAYFSRRLNNTESKSITDDSLGMCCDTLDDFSQVLHGMSQYGSFRRLASLNYNVADATAALSIVSSIEFDKDGEFFILAGVAKRIKVYEFQSVIKNTDTLHYPVTQLQCTSKISNVSWNPYCKNTLASSDYDGTVQLWDTSLAKSIRRYQINFNLILINPEYYFYEHEKRCWTVVFNSVDPHLMASGSDDARVKLWSIGVDRSVATIDAKVNVCCVCFSPTQRNYLVFGSADHCIHLYDIRKPLEPVNVFRGHRKAVSYVKYCTENEVVSASTDSNLRLWDVSSGKCIRTMKGHQNERNFVGLATDGNHIVCGSENNHLYLYHKGLCDPLMCYDFGRADSARSTLLATDSPSDFVSAVSWKKNSNIVVAANSQGTTHVFELI
ncbi:Cyclin-G-associated kinase [Dirofilaria immitis]